MYRQVWRFWEKEWREKPKDAASGEGEVVDRMQEQWWDRVPVLSQAAPGYSKKKKGEHISHSV